EGVFRNAEMAAAQEARELQVDRQGHPMHGPRDGLLQRLLHEGRGRPDLVEAVEDLGPGLRVAGQFPGGIGDVVGAREGRLAELVDHARGLVAVDAEEVDAGPERRDQVRGEAALQVGVVAAVGVGGVQQARLQAGGLEGAEGRARVLGHAGRLEGIADDGDLSAHASPFGVSRSASAALATASSQPWPKRRSGLSAAPVSQSFQAWTKTRRRSVARSATAPQAASSQACNAPGLAPCQVVGASCERGVVSWAAMTSGIAFGARAAASRSRTTAWWSWTRPRKSGLITAPG